MKNIGEKAFSASMDIVTAALNGETEAKLSKEGAGEIVDFFGEIYEGIKNVLQKEENASPAEKRAGRIVIKKTAAGYSFNLFAPNQEIIATSQVYTSHAACLNGAESVIKNASCAVIVDETVKTLK